ncbi:MAG: hypothetical protein ABIH41_02000 [Nanoarchaeota archaeon]
MNLTSLVVVLGIFVSMAFFAVSYNLYRKQLGIGYWPFFAVAALSFTVAEFALTVLQKDFAFQYFFIVGMLIMFFAALLKFWSIMRLIE